MSRWGLLFTVAFLTSLSYANSSLGQDLGVIKGRVLDDKGIALSGAKVNADPLDGRIRASAIRYVETDSEGQFLIDHLEWGKYLVFAMKEEAGFPNMAFLFYRGNVAFTANLTPSEPTTELQMRLGPKAGVLIGYATHRLNGAPVNVEVKLTRAASPDDWFSTSVAPSFRVLLPSSTNVLLEISAPGFKTWNPGHPLRLEPGAEMRLDIQLEPSHDPNLHPSKFLVPEGFTGWLLLDYGVKGVEPVPREDGVQIFKFPASGALSTSSAGPERGAEDEYFHYSPDGSLHQIPTDYRNGEGMIWGQHEGTRNGVLSQFGFFVGTEEQYKKFQTRMTHPGPIPTP